MGRPALTRQRIMLEEMPSAALESTTTRPSPQRAAACVDRPRVVARPRRHGQARELRIVVRLVPGANCRSVSEPPMKTSSPPRWRRASSASVSLV